MLLINGSSREISNSTYLAKQVLKDIAYKEINLKDYNISPIIDKRHDINGFENIEMSDDYNNIIQKFIDSETVIFSSPIYWYTFSSQLKLFIDRFSESLRVIEGFKEKLVDKNIYLVLVGGDEPREKGKIIIKQFEYICNFFPMNLKDCIIGEARKPMDILNDEKVLQEAEELNIKLKKREALM